MQNQIDQWILKRELYNPAYDIMRNIANNLSLNIKGHERLLQDELCRLTWLWGTHSRCRSV